MSLPTSKLVNEFIETILQYLFDNLGKNNIISVLLTGSVARGRPAHKYIDGKLFLESDFDLVVVVNRRFIIKSLILIKKISTKLTSKLRNRGLLSHVSLVATTEAALRNSGPSIFYQDLHLNGKIIYGKNIIKTLFDFEPKQIPSYDVNRLLFNRMVELLEIFAANILNEEKNTRRGYELTLNFIEKLTFALIQSLLIKENILIFRGYNLDELPFEYGQLKNKELLSSLVESYNELKNAIQDQENISISIIRKHVDVIIEQFRLTLDEITNIEDFSPDDVKKLFNVNENLGKKLRLSIILLLQYVNLLSISDLLYAIAYIIRHGSDHVYIHLYRLFLSSESLLKFMDVEEISKDSIKGSSFVSTSNINNYKLWQKLFHRYFKIWKIKTGM